MLLHVAVGGRGCARRRSAAKHFSDSSHSVTHPIATEPDGFSLLGTNRALQTLNFLKEREHNMSLRINDVAPDFTAETTQGTIHFHDWIGDNWAVFFSHPKDFTPVCTTELGAVAQLEPQFKQRGAKVIGLSVDK